MKGAVIAQRKVRSDRPRQIGQSGTPEWVVLLPYDYSSMRSITPWQRPPSTWWRPQNPILGSYDRGNNALSTLRHSLGVGTCNARQLLHGVDAAW